MNREDAVALVKAHTKRRNIFYHMLAVEAIMKALADHLGQDSDLWGLAGLVHDVDYEKTAENFEKHGILAQEILKGKVPEEILKAIKAHNYEHSGVKPETALEKALIASDAVSGLIVACALVMPSKKLDEVRVETVEKKFKDKDFARGADRQRIALCEELGMPREEFFKVALEGLQAAGHEIGL